MQSSRTTAKHVLVTGGCGFVGTNLAERLLAEGRTVCVLDDLSRPGAERNLAWLRAGHGDRLRVEVSDIRDAKVMRRAVRNASAVFHLAAQVAVTSSLLDPIHDFQVNAFGTLNVLEALRAQADPAPLFFASTNKVYGSLADLPLIEAPTRWTPADGTPGLVAEGPTSPQTPYGCSKTAAEQYVLDYVRTFGIRAVALRMSCVYGPHQFGNEDQGWIAHLALRMLENKPITIFGDGKQVRDALFIDDAVEAYLAAWRHIDRTSGQTFNLGGGSANTTSLVEMIESLTAISGVRPEIRYAPRREGDARHYVSDTTTFREVTGWKPAVELHAGLVRLHAWLLTTRRTSRMPGIAALPSLPLPVPTAAPEPVMPALQ